MYGHRRLTAALALAAVAMAKCSSETEQATHVIRITADHAPVLKLHHHFDRRREPWRRVKKGSR